MWAIAQEVPLSP